MKIALNMLKTVLLILILAHKKPRHIDGALTFKLAPKRSITASQSGSTVQKEASLHIDHTKLQLPCKAKGPSR